MAAQPPPARPPLRMSRQLGWYVALVAAAGLGVIATSLWALPGTPRATEWLLLASAGVLMAWWSTREIGGQTGDVIGALEQVNEIVVLLVAAALVTHP